MRDVVRSAHEPPTFLILLRVKAYKDIAGRVYHEVGVHTCFVWNRVSGVYKAQYIAIFEHARSFYIGASVSCLIPIWGQTGSFIEQIRDHGLDLCSFV